MTPERSAVYQGMLALAKAGIRRVWLRDDVWCALAREVCGGTVEGTALAFYSLQVYPRCLRRSADA